MKCFFKDDDIYTDSLLWQLTTKMNINSDTNKVKLNLIELN